MKRGGKNKGNAYERRVCKELSLWWSKGKNDFVFWRSDASGGMATSRRKVGKQTLGQFGDVAAVHPDGHPFLEACVIEIKRGYSQKSVADILDRQAKHKQQLFETWVDSVMTDHEAADSFAWMIIACRDRREPLIWMPRYLFTHVISKQKRKTLAGPTAQISTDILRVDGKAVRLEPVELVGVFFESFLAVASVNQFKSVAN